MMFVPCHVEQRASAVNNVTSCDPTYLAAAPEVGVIMRKRSEQRDLV